MDIVEYIYNETIDVFIENLEEIDELKIRYKNYLNKLYKQYDINKLRLSNKLDLIVEIEKNRWRGTSPDYKKRQMINDDNFNKLWDLSNYFYQAALKKIDTKLEMKIDVEYYKKLLETLYNNVCDFNKAFAYEIYSESILDLLYSCTKTSNMSLRVSRKFRDENNYLK